MDQSSTDQGVRTGVTGQDRRSEACDSVSSVTLCSLYALSYMAKLYFDEGKLKEGMTFFDPVVALLETLLNESQGSVAPGASDQ